MTHNEAIEDDIIRVETRHPAHFLLVIFETEKVLRWKDSMCFVEC